MKMHEPEDITKIAQKIEWVISQNPDYFVTILAGLRPGEPVPFDEKLGITKAEHEKFLKYGKNPGFIRGREDQLQFKISGKTLFIKTKNKKNPLRKISLNLKQMTLKTPYGIIDKYEKVKRSEAAIGPFVGIQWLLKAYPQELNFESLEGRSITFTLGHLNNSKTYFIYYDVKVLRGFQKEVFYRYIQYDL